MIKKIIILFVVVLVLMYLIPLSLVLINQNSKITNKVDYLIVLGAKVNQDNPSNALEYRLNETVTLYEKYPSIKIVVTGGQGADEDYTEAYVMKKYLIENGVAPESIILEDKSTSTFENLVNSKALINNDDASIGVVTNGFHIYRAKLICDRVFTADCKMQASRNPQSVQGLISIIREPLALYKSFFLDR